MRIRRLIKGIGHRVGYDIQRVERTMDRARQRLLKHNDIDLVLDVGANSGQYVRELRRSGYERDVISFEPIPEVYEELARSRRGDGSWTGRNVALGARCERTVFHVSANAVSSSLLEVTQKSVDALNTTRKARDIEVQVSTLDSELERGPLGRRTHLKLDTQGSEMAVLAGAKNCLSQIATLECELSFVELYSGQPLIHDVLKFLHASGFKPIWMDHGFRNAAGEMLQVDALFSRSE